MNNVNRNLLKAHNNSYLLGPQFSLQASSTAVNERPPKQKEGGSSSSSSIKTQQMSGGESGHTFLRSHSIESSNNVMAANQHIMPESRSGTRSKQRGSIIPATAYAHDLTRPDPTDDLRSMRSTSSSSSSRQAPVYLPGDRVVFAESPSAPGIPIVYRTPDERSANPDRLNLDRRHLTVCPILEGEDQLRLLNYQHNMILRIQHLNGLKRLIFLDLYDNQIEEISGLSSLRSLRVLMLGKNKISKIENLDNLGKLDVLDLHGNQISRIEKLGHLSELRVLNLAGNKLTHVDQLLGLDALTELNLRRNNINHVGEVDNLPSLQRLFLSFNDITCELLDSLHDALRRHPRVQHMQQYVKLAAAKPQAPSAPSIPARTAGQLNKQHKKLSFEDIACLSDSHSLSEISLDGNPLAAEAGYKQTVLRSMQQLRQLDMKRVSEDERRVAAVMARKEEEKKRESSKIQVMKERRRQAINNARRQWEVMQGSVMGRANRLVRDAMPDLYANHMGSYVNGSAGGESDGTTPQSSRSSSRLSRPTSGQSDKRSIASSRGSEPLTPVVAEPPPPPASLSAPHLDHLKELEGDTLSLYGTGAIDAFDKNWGIQAAGAVTTISFKFIDFDLIIKQLHKIRVRFPNVHTLLFNSTNICRLQQLNALAQVRRLDALVIEPDGNPITQFTLWRTYLLFRLAHFSLKKINDIDVSASDIVNAEKFFGTLAHITTSQLPQARLLSMLGESKRKQLLAADDKKKAGGVGSDIKLTDRASESVGRAGLTYSPSAAHRPQEQVRREFVQRYVKELASAAVHTEQKESVLQRLWPQILTEMVRKAVIDMYDGQAYAKKALEDLEKS